MKRIIDDIPAVSAAAAPGSKTTAGASSGARAANAGILKAKAAAPPASALAQEGHPETCESVDHPHLFLAIQLHLAPARGMPVPIYGIG